MRTKGEVRADVHGVWADCHELLGSPCHSERPKEENTANAHTWATAHNTANAIDALGLDGDNALGPALVELVSLAKHYMWERYDVYNQEQLEAMLGRMFYEFVQAIKREGV